MSGIRILSILIGVGVFALIIDLVRRRRLREEYSWLWLLTGASIVVLSVWYDLLVRIGAVLGGIFPSSILFFFGLIFLIVISLYQSVKISHLTDQMKVLAQETALLKEKKALRDADSGQRL